MSVPNVRKPTKKAFHFPKNSKGKEAAVELPVAEPQVEAESSPLNKSTKAPRASVPKAEKVAAPVEVKAKRAKKEKVVRDSFTMPKSDYEKIDALKKKCLDAGVSVKKSELLRAGLLMLEAAAPKRLLAAVSAVEAVKTGRPAKE
ncbi:hypothetical protein [Paraburkholderia fungorum]|uniref:hypothetical protein n=1 Tax=Paraburkholderia fungorum TaxID=134537 RepID=UPI0038779152